MKLGKGTEEGDFYQIELELELRTPKSPMTQIIRTTQCAQTCEEEFEEPLKKQPNKSSKVVRKKIRKN